MLMRLASPDFYLSHAKGSLEYEVTLWGRRHRPSVHHDFQSNSIDGLQGRYSNNASNGPLSAERCPRFSATLAQGVTECDEPDRDGNNGKELAEMGRHPQVIRRVFSERCFGVVGICLQRVK